MLCTVFFAACLTSCCGQREILCANAVGTESQINLQRALAWSLEVFEPTAALRAPSSPHVRRCSKEKRRFGACIPGMCTGEGVKPGVQSSYFHIPVMLQEVISGLITDRNGTYVDATVGGGGHASAILQALNSKKAHLLCLDRDPEALKAASQRLRPHIAAGTATLVHSNFAMLAQAMTLLPSRCMPRQGLASGHVDGVLHGILLDLGPSSYQLDEPSRGFSPEHDGPLDMRMDQSGNEQRTAWDIVNHQSAEIIRDILLSHVFPTKDAKMRMSSIAERICSKRPISTTFQLRQVVGEMFGTAGVKIVFEALRREVNQDFSAHEAVLNCAARLLRKDDGRLAVISYGARQDLEVSRHLEYTTEWRLVTEKRHASNDKAEGTGRAQQAVLRIYQRTRQAASPIWAIKQRYMERSPTLAPIRYAEGKRLKSLLSELDEMGGV